MFGRKKSKPRKSKSRKKRKAAASSRSPMEYGQVESDGLATLKDMLAYRKVTARHTAWWRFLILLMMLLGLLGFGFSLKTSNEFSALITYTTNQLNQSTSEKPGKQEAIRAVNAWLASENNPPYPSGFSNLTWDGARKIDSNTDAETKVTTERWSHTLSFTDKADGSTRKVAQLVAVAGGIPTAQGKPSVLPAEITGSGNTDTSAPKAYYSLSQSDAMLTLVQQWAKAYLGKDTNALTVLVGDPDASHGYAPANMGVFKSAGINWAVSLQKRPTDGSSVEIDKNPEYGAASVTMTFTPYGAKEGSAQGVSTTMTVLIKNPTTGAAKVVDWGADADVESLKEYANALDKTRITKSSESAEDQQASDGASAGASASPSASGDAGAASPSAGASPSDGASTGAAASPSPSDAQSASQPVPSEDATSASPGLGAAGGQQTQVPPQQ